MFDISSLLSINSSRFATLCLWIAAITGIAAAVASLLSAIFSNNATKVAEKKTASEIARLDVARREFANRILEADARTALAEAAIAEANKKSADLELESSRLRSRTALAETAIAEANRKSANLELESSRLRLTLSSATREITGRFVTKSQSQKLFSQLIGTHPEVIVRHSDDEESSSFALSIVKAFREAGAEVDVAIPYRATYREYSTDWSPVEITPPKRKFNDAKSLDQVMSDPVILAAISSGIVDTLGPEEGSREHEYLITVRKRAARKDGTLERSSAP